MPTTGRRALLRIAGRATFLAGAALAAWRSPATAQDETPGIIGSWAVNPQPANSAAPPYSTFLTFIPGGGFTRAGLSHPTESPGYGAWRQVGDAEFEFTYQVDQFDKQGTFIGRRNAWVHLTIDATGMVFTGRTRGTLIDLDNNMAPPTTGAIRAERMVAEPFEA